MAKVLTMILAGGKGLRLEPLTRDRAKPAIPFGGVYRIIDFTLSNCINSGLRKILVLTQYRSMSLHRHILDGWSFLNREFEEYIDAVPPQQMLDDQWYLGTADAVRQNLYSIRTENPDYVLILAGDHIYKMNYGQMIDFHIAHGGEATVGTIEVPLERAQGLGIVEVGEQERIVGFEEKPAQPKSLPDRPDFARGSMGIYLFNSAVLCEIVEQDAGRDSEHDFGRNIIPDMVNTGRSIYAYNFLEENKQEPKYWRDVGTIDAYWNANMDLVHIVPTINLYDRGWPIRTFQPQYPPAKFILSGADGSERTGLALNSIVSQGCIISGGQVHSSILSPNVRINSYVEVHESILFEGVNVGRYAKIRRAIIDNDVDIPEGTEIGYNLELDRQRFTVSERGVVVVTKGVLGQV